jgi:putative addiction module antidote
MGRKVFRTGNSIVVSLPREFIESLGIREGSEVEVELDRENHQINIRPTKLPLAAGIHKPFALQVAEFIEEYRPALEALAK